MSELTKLGSQFDKVAKRKKLRPKNEYSIRRYGEHPFKILQNR